jgi:hypothetical protein
METDFAIEKLPSGLFRMAMPESGYWAICNCFNEVCNGVRIEDFEKLIGVSKADANRLGDTVRATRAMSDAAPDPRVRMDGSHRYSIELTEANLRVVRAAIYETCNHIHLWEFQTRVGEDMEAVLGMLRLITDALKP